MTFKLIEAGQDRWRAVNGPTPGRARACPADHGTGSRSQILIGGKVDGSAERVVAFDAPMDVKAAGVCRWGSVGGAMSR